MNTFNFYPEYCADPEPYYKKAFKCLPDFLASLVYYLYL